jgi:nitroreductase/NAD-dependent dihydropyrimidine dehydrogenase PreA subunit
MNTITIDADKCLQDGICVQACPFGVFTQTEDGTAAVVQGAEAGCINCGHCIALCPGAAITVNGTGSEDCQPVRKELQVSKEQAVQFFRTRRSIRAYKDTPVDRSILEKLLDMSRWAPTAKNAQPVHWIVFQESGDITYLSRMVINWMRMKDIQPNVVQAFDQGIDIIHRNAPCLLVAHASSSGIKPVEDCTIAAATVEAAAPAFGLGACWAGFFMSAAGDSAPIRDFLQLPEGHGVFSALMLGYPKFTYRRIPPRDKLKVEWR